MVSWFECDLIVGTVDLDILRRDRLAIPALAVAIAAVGGVLKAGRCLMGICRTGKAGQNAYNENSSH